MSQTAYTIAIAVTIIVVLAVVIRLIWNGWLGEIGANSDEMMDWNEGDCDYALEDELSPRERSSLHENGDDHWRSVQKSLGEGEEVV